MNLLRQKDNVDAARYSVMTTAQARHRWSRTGAAILSLCILCNGCVVVYQPSATKGGIVLHEQTATNMTITESVPVTGKLADSITGISASASGNSIGSPNIEAKLK